MMVITKPLATFRRIMVFVISRWFRMGAAVNDLFNWPNMSSASWVNSRWSCLECPWNLCFDLFVWYWCRFKWKFTDTKAADCHQCNNNLYQQHRLWGRPVFSGQYTVQYKADTIGSNIKCRKTDLWDSKMALSTSL